MGKRVIIIGAVALGPKTACRLKRLDPDCEITVIDRDSYISYGGCGIPYYVSGDVQELEGLCSTSAHVVRDSNYFKNVKAVDVVTCCEAESINRKDKTVVIKNTATGESKVLNYDYLVLGTGATSFIPPIEGADLPGVTAVSNLHQAKFVKESVAKGQVEKAVVIGGGAIGLEMAEALTDLWGVETTLIEMMDQLVPPAFGKDMALIIKNHMEEKGVRVLLNERVTKIKGDKEKGVTAVVTGSEEFPCELVIMASGVRPNSKLAKEAGLAVGSFGGILVNDRMQTSDPFIYAGGDCVEITHLVSGQTVHMPLGSLANRQGRVIGTNIAGKNAQIKGTVGSFCLKVFDLGIARAGLTVKQAEQAGFDPVYSVVVQADRAHFYPTMELMYVKLIADRKTRRVLGIEAVGPHGDAVKARVDAVAPLLQYNTTVSDIANLEVSYAPPFASAMDIVNNAANSLDNILEGLHEPVDVTEFFELFKKGGIKVLDVRSEVQSGPFVEKYGDAWINIPQEVLVQRIDEVPKDEPIILVCGSGPRSYETQLVLRSRNINKKTRNIQGGVGMIKASDPDFAP